MLAGGACWLEASSSLSIVVVEVPSAEDDSPVEPASSQDTLPLS